MTTTPAHLLPDACYVCGGTEDAHTKHAAHRFWANRDAAAEFTAADRNQTFAYSGGATTVEAQFVESTRGR